ncbi:glycosyltransferase [Brachybacterium tyrofermentans]|uniref:glycosyltransferase n=1 Tax=Brachybacterium tyrofermentans TaxID=47848 RepID=UPI003FBA4C49
MNAAPDPSPLLLASCTVDAAEDAAGTAGLVAGTSNTAQTAQTAGTAGTTATASLWEQAFPVSVWRTVLGASTVAVQVEGARATLWGSRDGRRLPLGPLVDGHREISLAADDHDWLWVEGEVRSVAWTTARSITTPQVTVVMPTYRREADAVAQAARFARMQCVQHVIVVDQGDSLADHDDFRRLQRSAPEIQLITQANLGGSGGYARGMRESERFPQDAVLLSDDDAIISEESLRRMVTFQSLAAQPTILGTPLFSAQDPMRLTALSEAVRANDFQWHAADGVRGPVDLTGTSPDRWTFLRARGEANYTGWWATLLPPGTVAELGLPAPFFLKWDDAEYGLRATRHGYRHVVLPGTSVTHPPWDAFRTQMSWTSRVLHRNRLATAAAYDAGRGVILSSLLHQLKHILSGHHLTATLWDHGIDAFLAGPSSWLGLDLERARADGQELVTRWNARNPTSADALPTPRAAPLPLAPALLRALLRIVRPDAEPRVVVAMTAEQLHWRTALGADAVIITDGGSPDGAVHLVRGSTARHLLTRTLGRHLRMALRWSSLRRQYRRDLPRATTEAAWAEQFDRSVAPSHAENGGS